MSMYVPVQQHAEGLQGPAAVPKVWMLLIGLILLWIYGYRIFANPLTWEEPRRCLVALEMIYRGDYVVPHVLGEPYRNKPPLQNWLIVLFAGNQANGVGPGPIRLISLLSLLGISWCLWQLAQGQLTTYPAWLPVLIFLTMGIVIQYGRSGELDALFTFWIVAALYCFGGDGPPGGNGVFPRPSWQVGSSPRVSPQCFSIRRRCTVPGRTESRCLLHGGPF
jgi:hypothetical protein